MARDTKIGDVARWACHGRARFEKQTQRRRVLGLVRNVNVHMERLTANGKLGIRIELTAVARAPINSPLYCLRIQRRIAPFVAFCKFGFVNIRWPLI